MSVTENIANAEGLPKQFVSSLRILFDILDEKRSGFVRFQDIEVRWNEEGVTGLPFGVVDALRKVTPANGCLTFERFVSGLKLALLTSTKQKSQTGKHDKENRSSVIRYADTAGSGRQIYQEGVAPAPHQQTQHHIYAVPVKHNAPATAAVKPNNAINTTYRRAGSHQHIDQINSSNNKKVMSPPRPARPPSYHRHVEKGEAPPQIPPRERTRSQGNKVLTELKTWQRDQGQRQVETDRLKRQTQLVNDRSHRFQTASSDSRLQQQGKKYNSSDPHAIYANIETFQRKPNDEVKPQRATVQRRNSGRRHTLSSGVDYNMIKRMKQLEDEKEVLLQGQKILDQAKEWYHKQITQLQDKQNYAGKLSYNDYSLEANQERMNFQKARIVEVNQHLRTLIESSEKGFPLHMNLAIRPTPNLQDKEQTIQMLKGQNRQLTNEIGQKDDKISQLEQEKSSLIRELFESRSQGKTNYDDTTFM